MSAHYLRKFSAARQRANGDTPDLFTGNRFKIFGIRRAATKLGASIAVDLESLTAHELEQFRVEIAGHLRQKNRKQTQPMKIEITNRFTGAVLFSGEYDSLKTAAIAAVEKKTDLRGADLRGADLSGADLRGADLSGADLAPIKSDFLAEVIRLPGELEFLRDALVEGRVDGSTYSGECACLAGTLAHANGIKNYDGGEIKNGLTFHADSSSPREQFFLNIRRGDTPKKNPFCKIALEWTEEAIAIRDNIIKAAWTPAKA